MTDIPKEFYLPFVKKEQVARGVYSFYFDRRVQHGFNFLPGQYIRMTLNLYNPDNRGSSRPFTISSSPLDKDYIVITTKVIKSSVPNGTGQSSFKKRLIELSAGEKVKLFGPLGGFVLNEEEKDERVFLAGGIGITPFYSMITYAYAKKLSIPITLIVSFSTIEDLIFREELEDIASRNSHIKVIYTITHLEKSNVKWEGDKGRISENLIKKHVPNILNPRYLIVGPPAMVAAMEEVVRKMGVGNEKIFIENFTGY